MPHTRGARPPEAARARLNAAAPLPPSPCLPACLQVVLTFNYSDYVCGQEYQFFAWASNAYGQSAQYLPYNKLLAYQMPECFS